MPVPTRPQNAKNIWVAAGDGDLDRVRELIEHESVSPNAPDAFTYTPMHAAASYGQIHILEYLVSNGGDPNIQDSDGDTPLYTVEDVDTARWLVQHGAVVDRVNSEGISPIAHLTEESFPAVAAYLSSLLASQANSPSITTNSQQQTQPSQYAQNAASEALTAALLGQVADLANAHPDANMESSTSEDSAEMEMDAETEAELRRLVGRTVLEGMGLGLGMSEEEQREDDNNRRDDEDGKRPRI